MQACIKLLNFEAVWSKLLATAITIIITKSRAVHILTEYGTLVLTQHHEVHQQTTASSHCYHTHTEQINNSEQSLTCDV